MVEVDAPSAEVVTSEDVEPDEAAILDADDVDPIEQVDPADLERPPDLDALGSYLRGIGRYSLLTAEREVELAKMIEAGERAHERLRSARTQTTKKRRADERASQKGDEARTEMIEANLRLVVAMARRYRWTGMPLLDLIQEGNIGLMRGVSKFDWRKGFKFSTYATWWIRQAIQRGIADRSRIIRLPVHVHELILQISRAKLVLKAELGRDPTDAEIAAAAWLPIARVREVNGFSSLVLSFETPVGSEGEATLGEFIPDVEAAYRYDDVLQGISREEAMKVISTLNERERRIIGMRFGLTGEEPLTLEEVGKHFNLTRERIRQLEAKALAKLRHPSRSAALRIES